MNSPHKLQSSWGPWALLFLNHFDIHGFYDDFMQHSETPPCLTLSLHVKTAALMQTKRAALFFSSSMKCTRLWLPIPPVIGEDLQNKQRPHVPQSCVSFHFLVFVWKLTPGMTREAQWDPSETHLKSVHCPLSPHSCHPVIKHPSGSKSLFWEWNIPCDFVLMYKRKR